MIVEEVDRLLIHRRQSVCPAPAPEAASGPTPPARPQRPPHQPCGTPAGSLASGGAPTRTAAGLTALDAELATRGYLLTAPLRQALGALPPSALAERGRLLLAGVDGLLGADRVHIPLFRHFPDSVPYGPAHTLYTTRIQAYLASQPHQPCMVCGLAGSLVAPIRGCGHLVCRTCWDEAPSACCAECCTWRDCPVCEERVGTDGPGSPWSPLPARRTGTPGGAGSPLLRVLRLEPSRGSAARQELAALLARRTPLSPQDHLDLSVLLTYVVPAEGDTEHGGTEDGGVPEWLPARIPLRENKALALDALLTTARPLPAEVLRSRLDTATDVLRLLCVRSGGVPDLLAPPPRYAALPRPLRRLLLEILDGFRFEALAEDLARHPELWKRAAERLHPFEYAARFPRAALAFAALRGTDATSGDRLSELLMAEAAHHPDHVRLTGDRLRLTTWSGRVESALAAYDIAAAARLLAARPGELMRRLSDLLCRAELRGDGLPEAVTEALVRALPSAAPGPLLGALGALRAGTAAYGGAARDRPTGGDAVARRVFFPRSNVSRTYAVPELRPPLSAESTGAICALIEAELLDRLAAPGRADADAEVATEAEAEAAAVAYDAAVLDAGLADLPVPTAERGVAASLAAIPRGSSLPMPEDGDRVRLFLHWRQPTGQRVDLDLSVAMYDAEWRFVGLCDYTALEYAGGGAVHSGDLTEAPGPHGATEYVDLDLPRLAGAGVCHLVVAVLSYNDVPFEELPDAFAGFMELGEGRDGEAVPGRPARRTRRQVRKDQARDRTRYDPRTVRQRFDLTGDAKIRVPMTVDLSTRRALWTDVTLAAGTGGRHNVWGYRTRMAWLGRDLADAFAPGTRVTLWDLACWHAAARTRPGAPVFVRAGRGLRTYRRRPDESVHGFAVRLCEDWAPDSSQPSAEPSLTAAGQVFSALVHADLPGLPPTATGTAYRLYPGGADATEQRLAAAGDLVAELAPRTGQRGGQIAWRS